MDATPAQRFIRLRLPVDGHSATFTLKGLAGEPPSRANHEILGGMAAADPTRAQAIETKLNVLIGREAELFSWLESDPGHTALFLKDPVAALRTAFPDLGADFFKELADGT